MPATKVLNVFRPPAHAQELCVGGLGREHGAQAPTRSPTAPAAAAAATNRAITLAAAPAFGPANNTALNSPVNAHAIRQLRGAGPNKRNERKEEQQPTNTFGDCSRSRKSCAKKEEKSVGPSINANI